ncbi:MAG: PKD domain-containing protein, partial [Halobacteria archaeon]|nr:PKD domain-containing protein [Halobacteria archaeon]
NLTSFSVFSPLGQFESEDGGDNNQAPTASLSYSPSNPSVNDTVEFNGSASFDSDGSIVDYQWYVDGQRLGVGNEVISHEFQSSSNYRVKLVVVDDDGVTDEVAKTVQVSGQQTSLRNSTQSTNVSTGGNRPPVAIANAPETVFTNQALELNGSASFDTDGNITDYNWDFDGDGTFDDSGEVVQTTYTTEGNYTVFLNVTDNGGATNSTQVEIEVTNPVVANFTVETTTPSVNETVG